jgi:hypothetical protein
VNLAALLLDDEDIGLGRIVAGDGAISAGEYADLASDPAGERVRLRSHETVSIAQRTWTDGEQLVRIALLGHASPSGAATAAAERRLLLAADRAVRIGEGEGAVWVVVDPDTAVVCAQTVSLVGEVLVEVSVLDALVLDEIAPVPPTLRPPAVADANDARLDGVVIASLEVTRRQLARLRERT